MEDEAFQTLAKWRPTADYVMLAFQGGGRTDKQTDIPKFIYQFAVLLLSYGLNNDISILNPSLFQKTPYMP